MPSLYPTPGNRLIVRHVGPAGEGIAPGGTTGQILRKVSGADYDTEWTNPPDGTGAVTGPLSAVDGNFAAFDGIDGSVIKDSGYSPTSFANSAQLANKVDKIIGKGLSTEDFATADKAKLDALKRGGYVGYFATSGDLPAPPAVDAADQPGCWALVTSDIVGMADMWHWNDNDNSWEQTAPNQVDVAAIAAELFTDGGTYDEADCYILTGDEKAKIAESLTTEGLTELLTGTGGILASSYGAIDYFSVAGTTVDIVSSSDSTTNLIKIAPTSNLYAACVDFTSGAASRLTYTGLTAKTFVVNATVSLSCTSASDVAVSLFKTGSQITGTRMLANLQVSSVENTVTIHALVSLAENDYLELYVGNLTGTTDVIVHALQMTAVLA